MKILYLMIEIIGLIMKELVLIFLNICESIKFLFFIKIYKSNKWLIGSTGQVGKQEVEESRVIKMLMLNEDKD